MLRIGKSASRGQRRRRHEFGAQEVESCCGTNHVDDGIRRTDLMERHFTERTPCTFASARAKRSKIARAARTTFSLRLLSSMRRRIEAKRTLRGRTKDLDHQTRCGNRPGVPPLDEQLGFIGQAECRNDLVENIARYAQVEQSREGHVPGDPARTVEEEHLPRPAPRSSSGRAESKRADHEGVAGGLGNGQRIRRAAKECPCGPCA